MHAVSKVFLVAAFGHELGDGTGGTFMNACGVWTGRKKSMDEGLAVFSAGQISGGF